MGAAAIRSQARIPVGVTLAVPDIQYEDGAQPGLVKQLVQQMELSHIGDRKLPPNKQQFRDIAAEHGADDVQLVEPDGVRLAGPQARHLPCADLQAGISQTAAAADLKIVNTGAVTDSAGAAESTIDSSTFEPDN